MVYENKDCEIYDPILNLTIPLNSANNKTKQHYHLMVEIYRTTYSTQKAYNTIKCPYVFLTFNGKLLLLEQS